MVCRRPLPKLGSRIRDLTSTASFTESEVEAAALEWLEGLGWKVAHGPDIGPHADGAERADYAEVVLEHRLRDALGRLNPHLPAEALDDAFCKLTRVLKAPRWKPATARSTGC